MAIEEGAIEAETTPEGGRGRRITLTREPRGEDARMCGPATVDPLDGAPDAIGLDDSRSEARRDPDCVGNTSRIQTKELRSGSSCTQRPTDRRRMPASLEEHV